MPWFVFLLFCTISYCTNVHYFCLRHKIIWMSYNKAQQNGMWCTALSITQARLVCTKSESVSVVLIGTFEHPRAEPHHPTQLYRHRCSKCFIKTRAYSLRVDHVGCSHSITSCMLLQNTCEVMKQGQTLLQYGSVQKTLYSWRSSRLQGK